MKSIFCLTQFLVILFISAISAKTPVNYGIPVISLWEIGFSSGVSIYGTSFNMGSNAIPNRYSYWNRDLDPGIGLFVVRNISPSLGVEINWLNTRLTGKWKHRWAPIPVLTGRENPLTFSSQINQFDLMMVFNVNQIMLPGDEEDRGHFFIKTGIGIMAIKDNQRFYTKTTSSAISYALGGGYSVSLNEKLKLQVGSITMAGKTDNLDGVHVFSKDKNGQIVELKQIFEIYNYSYLSVSYSFGDFGLQKSKRRW